MIVKIEVLEDDLSPSRNQERDKVIMAVHRVFNGRANWEAQGDGFVARV